MKREEPPRGGRMLKQPEDHANAAERPPAPSENALAAAEEVADAPPRRTPRKRKKPFVL
jgi:hypothetical protein